MAFRQNESVDLVKDNSERKIGQAPSIDSADGVSVLSRKKKWRYVPNGCLQKLACEHALLKEKSTEKVADEIFSFKYSLGSRVAP